MRRLLVLLICLVLMPLAAPQRAQADPADIAAAARGVVRVVIVASDNDGVNLVGHGSGVAIAPRLVLTNAHVVSALAGNPAMRVGVVPPQGKGGYFARVVAISEKTDLALLELTEPGNLTPVALFSGVVGDSAEVWAVGYPGNVDAAQGFTAADYMTPVAPVKTRGNVSSGRPNKGFDAILHTAQLAAGNSGGPLLDPCGRVVGINSFGTETTSGTDSAFYFAVSMREISRFLLAAKRPVTSTGEPCKSQAEYMSEEERLAEEMRQAEEQRKVADASKRDLAMKNATRQAEAHIIASRENHIALAGLCLLLALAAGGAAFWNRHEGRKMPARIAAIGAFALVVGAGAAWFTRPPITDIDKLAADLVNSSMGGASASAPSDYASGNDEQALDVKADANLICVIDRKRSRITQSATTDVPVLWRGDGCINGKTQYARSTDGWSRILAPNSEDTVSVATFDPATRTYTTRRYLLDVDTMQKVRAARGKYAPPQCGAGSDAAARLADAQTVILDLLPEQPNERLVYACRPAR